MKDPSMFLKARRVCVLLLGVTYLRPFAFGQVFVGGGNSTDPPSIEAPEGLSEACSATYNEAVSCNIALSPMGRGDVVLDQRFLEFLCVDECLSSLEKLREKQLSSCSNSTDITKIGGVEYPPTFTVDMLIYTYNYTCLRDPETDLFCFPFVETWNTDTAAAGDQLC
ncbi:hypothetical protein SAPIO_CDS0959 [Scedosporium apiospermum]|uniref:Uncharacterized protein n=1 Tax=Pseudallescheria apiosperma TaxID=563466 RepID=A0A084GFJ5_PSEDA|nr:uncharacterized protein SAPIO_CDS0959 [Scedosporium apiospermum]KEZ46107.1 hypothetical protein SAPIO_CDS0959 [Scedosporium apiospermum]